MNGEKAKLLKRYSKLSGRKYRPLKRWYNSFPRPQRDYASMWLLWESMQLRAEKDAKAAKKAQGIFAKKRAKKAAEQKGDIAPSKSLIQRFFTWLTILFAFLKPSPKPLQP